MVDDIYAAECWDGVQHQHEFDSSSCVEEGDQHEQQVQEEGVNVHAQNGCVRRGSMVLEIN